MPLNTNTIWTPTRDVSVTALVEFGLGPLPLSRAVPTVGRYLSILIQFSFPGTIAELSLLLDSLDGFKADKFFPVNLHFEHFDYSKCHLSPVLGPWD